MDPDLHALDADALTALVHELTVREADQADQLDQTRQLLALAREEQDLRRTFPEG